VSCVSYRCGSLVSAPYNGKREPSCASPVCVVRLRDGLRGAPLRQDAGDVSPCLCAAV
jgi:hypothetical protein